MSEANLAIATVLGMATVTLATRWAGFWLLGRFELGPFARRMLDQVPGATFAALCAALLVGAGPLEWVGAALVAAIMLRGGHLLLALAASWALVAVLRQFPGII